MNCSLCSFVVYSFDLVSIAFGRMSLPEHPKCPSTNMRLIHLLQVAIQGIVYFIWLSILLGFIMFKLKLPPPPRERHIPPAGVHFVLFVEKTSNATYRFRVEITLCFSYRCRIQFKSLSLLLPPPSSLLPPPRSSSLLLPPPSTSSTPKEKSNVVQKKLKKHTKLRTSRKSLDQSKKQ